MIAALRHAWWVVASHVAWRVPGRPRRMLRAFSVAERGSMIDMLSAVERTSRRDLRRKYFRHALDEWRHARLFAERAAALGDGSREEAAVDEAGTLVEQGVAGGLTLHERLDEHTFHVFVHLAEADAVERFHVVLDHALPDVATREALRGILKDEQFHVSYSRAEVERWRKAGGDLDGARRRLRLEQTREAWLRVSRDVGSLVTGLWLGLLYLVVVAPFALLARLASREPSGWRSVPAPTLDPKTRARMEA